MNLVNTNNDDVRISSREVAEMMDVKKHSDMLAKIDKLDKSLNGKVRSVEYWLTSMYIDASGKSNREYLVTKKGCEFLALKSTGTKGIQFTIAYMNRFDEMKAKLIKIDSYMINDPVERAKAWIVEQEEKQQLANVIQIQAPKVEAYNKFIDSDGLISFDSLSDIINIGKNTMLKHLREMRVLKDDIFVTSRNKRITGVKHNTPYATHEKYFVVRPTKKTNPVGELYVKVFVKPESVEYLEKKIKDRIEYLENLKRAN